jgi:purine-cytosine permease-like protein
MTLTASVPPVGYLTYADQFMILQYVFITIALGIAIALFLLIGKENTEQAKKLHHMTRWVVPFLWVISMILLHLMTIGFNVTTPS